MAYLETQIATASRTVEAPERDYYDGAHRVTRDGVPCRVFIKRDKELSAQIKAIEIARDAGAEIALDDAPTFAFMPAPSDESGPYVAKGAKPVPAKPTAGEGKAYYATGKRYIIGGIPCRVAFAKLNHSFAHWADGSREGKFLADWIERADEWFEQWEAGDAVEGYIRAGDLAALAPVRSVEVREAVEASPEAPESPLDSAGTPDPIEASETSPEAPDSPQEDIAPKALASMPWEAVFIGDGNWIIRSGRAWLGHDGEFVFCDTREEAERIARALNREMDCGEMDCPEPVGLDCSPERVSPRLLRARLRMVQAARAGRLAEPWANGLPISGIAGQMGGLSEGNAIGP